MLSVPALHLLKSVLLTLCLFFVFAISLRAAPREAVPLWTQWEKSFEAVTDVPPDPATGLIVRLLSPSGKRHIVSAFFDGGKTWRVRFMPNEAGRWRYRTIAYPGYPGLSQQRGEFQCVRGRVGNRFTQHGAVQVARSRTHFAHADGTPFFFLGDTVWNGALMSAKDDWNQFLNDRVAKKFTAIQFIMESPWRSAPTDADGRATFTGREKIEINTQAFKRIDERIDAINARGLLAVPVLIWSNHRDDPGKFLPESEVIRLAKYMIARYGAHHVIWILAGDDRYVGENAERWKRIGRAVFEYPRAPVMMHPQGMQLPTDVFQSEQWISAIGYQSGHGDDANTLRWIHSGPVMQAWSQPPLRPFLNIEPPYEDHVAYQSKQRHTDYTMRRACYWSLMNAPAAGLTYGAHGIWSWETSAAEPLNHKGTGIAKPWHEAMLLPGSTQMKYLAEFFTALPWTRLRPAQELLFAQPGADDPAKFISAMRTPSGNVAIFYLPAGGEVHLRPETFSDRTKAEWFNPRDGKRQLAKVPGNGRYVAPDAQDWLLTVHSQRRGRIDN
jgi:hypothetical protein